MSNFAYRLELAPVIDLSVDDPVLNYTVHLTTSGGADMPVLPTNFMVPLSAKDTINEQAQAWVDSFDPAKLEALVPADAPAAPAATVDLGPIEASVADLGEKVAGIAAQLADVVANEAKQGAELDAALQAMQGMTEFLNGLSMVQINAVLQSTPNFMQDISSKLDAALQARDAGEASTEALKVLASEVQSIQDIIAQPDQNVMDAIKGIAKQAEKLDQILSDLADTRTITDQGRQSVETMTAAIQDLAPAVVESNNTIKATHDALDAISTKVDDQGKARGQMQADLAALFADVRSDIASQRDAVKVQSGVLKDAVDAIVPAVTGKLDAIHGKVSDTAVLDAVAQVQDAVIAKVNDVEATVPGHSDMDAKFAALEAKIAAISDAVAALSVPAPAPVVEPAPAPAPTPEPAPVDATPAVSTTDASVASGTVDVGAPIDATQTTDTTTISDI